MKDFFDNLRKAERFGILTSSLEVTGAYDSDGMFHTQSPVCVGFDDALAPHKLMSLEGKSICGACFKLMQVEDCPIQRTYASSSFKQLLSYLELLESRMVPEDEDIWLHEFDSISSLRRTIDEVSFNVGGIGVDPLMAHVDSMISAALVTWKPILELPAIRTQIEQESVARFIPDISLPSIYSKAGKSLSEELARARQEILDANVWVIARCPRLKVDELRVRCLYPSQPVNSDIMHAPLHLLDPPAEGLYVVTDGQLPGDVLEVFGSLFDWNCRDMAELLRVAKAV